MFVLTLLACTTPTPAPVGQAEVVLTSGEASIVGVGEPLPAVVGNLLTPTDRLVTGDDGMMVVALPNLHLVRIDSELDLVVQDLALWNADQSPIPVAEQLAVLLDDNPELVANSKERIAGWHARATTAYAPSGVVDKNEREPDAKPAQKREASAAQSAKPPADVTDSEPSPARRAPPAARRRVGVKGAKGSNAAGSGGGRPAAVASESARPGKATSSLPTARKLLLDQKTCLAAWYKELGLPAGPVRIRVKVENQVVTNVRAGGGLRLPKCARDAVVGKKVPADQALQFAIRLP